MAYEYDDLREAIKQKLRSLKYFRINCLYVTRSKGAKLSDEVREEIGGSDFVVADLSSPSGKGPRPNVMWELGYAEALGRSCVIITPEESRENVSSLIREHHYVTYNPHKREELLRELANAVDELCRRLELIKTHKRASNRFVAHACIDRPELNLAGLVASAERRIQILQTNLDCLQGTVGEQLVHALNDPTRPNLTVQLCALDPRSTFVSHRASQLAQVPTRYEAELLKSLHNTYGMLKGCDRSRWELRVYDTFPTQITFSIDDLVVVAPMSMGRRSRDLVHIQLQSGDRNVSDTYEAHFNTIYSLSAPYEEWLAKGKGSSSKTLHPPSLASARRQKHQ
jgi:nucleoside 2-deoxyribosyltransferase